MPSGDSSLQLIIMVPTQSIRPPPLLMGADSSTVGLQEDTQDFGEGCNNKVIQDLIMRL